MWTHFDGGLVMPSVAALKSLNGFTKADLLRSGSAASGSRADAQLFYHASLAMSVATWDAYLNDIVREFFSVIANPLDQQFGAMTDLSRQFASTALDKFNTPNFENSRTLLVRCTGYDPYADWAWPNRSMTVLQVNERLNQVLKVRHAFAHGSPVPAYTWTLGPTGKVRLTRQSVIQATTLLRHLIQCTDDGLRRHISAIYPLAAVW